MKQIIRRNKILALALLGYIILFIFNGDMILNAFNESAYYLVEMIKILPAIFILTSLIQTWVPTNVIMKNFGDGAGIKGMTISLAIGSLSAGPIYAAFPICRTLINKGASIENIIIILSSWAVIKVPMLINESKFMGVEYMLIRWIFTVIAIFIMAKIMKVWIKENNFKVEYDSYNQSKITVDEHVCIGCGSCVRNFPEIFTIKNGKAEVIENIIEQLSEEELKQSKESCPINAIR
ncbi:permease [Abyssisolibacter fermentans]|uniref:permease n=1 Tax=Abyssisolibacter fermentans TaxID=1766203 RepID=UPI0008337CCC|nr:permease [Abyssisolibacter fermentans]